MPKTVFLMLMENEEKKREREQPKKGCFSMLFYIRVPRCQFLGVSRHVDPVCSPEQDPCTEIL